MRGRGKAVKAHHTPLARFRTGFNSPEEGATWWWRRAVWAMTVLSIVAALLLSADTLSRRVQRTEALDDPW